MYLRLYGHTDIWGPTKIAFLIGMHYFVTFDNFSIRAWVHAMKTKDKCLGIFLKQKRIIEI